MLTTNNFSFNKSSRILSADASDLRISGGEKTLVVKSSHTNKEVTFTLSNTERDADNDIICWEYRPLVLGGEVNAKLVIWND